MENYSPNIFFVTGSKGKTSTSHFLSALLPNSGLFTSPHLISVRERIQVNKQVISEQDFTKNYYSQLNQPFQKLLLTAMKYYKSSNCQDLVIEPGIGGASDAVSQLNKFKLNSSSVLINSIELEHQKTLGNSLYEIAVNKALLATSSTKQVIIHSSNYENPEIYSGITDVLQDFNLMSKLKVSQKKPDYFQDAAQMALDAVGGGLVSKDSQGNIIMVKQCGALIKVQKPPGHCQIVQNKNNIIFIDGAHTSRSISFAVSEFRKQVSTSNKKKVKIIFSQTKDREWKSFLNTILQLDVKDVTLVPGVSGFDLNVSQQFGEKETIICEQIEQYLNSIGIGAEVIKDFASVEEMFSNQENDVLVVGSVHGAGVVAKALQNLKLM
ncbi:Dihydrofolate_synthase / Folylpolyglutamate synthase [Hexamita inflata]|uniref:tetrahydrofolate synthase n=1 Tax=Hexamita inflata TaxID=28002 RepID=A0AA86UU57_9EUKA|nr:Dihydrofolate synthase / Folylpolyglutamate synthase [Hexamita inflata]